MNRFLDTLGAAAFALAISWPRASIGQDNTWLIELDGQVYAQALPVLAFISDWRAPLRNGERAYAYGWLEFGVRQGAFQLSALSRYDYWLEYSADSAQFYYETVHKQDYSAGKTYEVRIDADQHWSQGVRFTHRFLPRPSLRIDAGLSILQARTLLHGNLSGQLRAIDSRRLEYSAQLDDWYSKDPLFDRQVAAPAGVGYTTDLAIDYSINSRYHFAARLIDPWGRLYWHSAPNTRAQVGSGRQTAYDDSGFPRIEPQLSGIESTRDYTQRLRPRAHAQLVCLTDRRLQPMLQSLYLPVMTQWSIGLRWLGSATARWDILWNTSTRALAWAHRRGPFEFRITSDRFQPHDAHLLGLTAQYQAAF